MYYVYMLRCEDQSIYTGLTTDLNRRMEEHFAKGEKCAKYTRRHNAIKLETAWITESRVLASKLEYRIKTLTKKQKESLIVEPNLLALFFPEQLEASQYENIGTLKEK